MRLTKNLTGSHLTVHTVHVKPFLTLVPYLPKPLANLSKFVLNNFFLLLLLPIPFKLFKVQVNLALPFQVLLLDSSLVLPIPHLHY
jgi:hypothetical protein